MFQRNSNHYFLILKVFFKKKKAFYWRGEGKSINYRDFISTGDLFSILETFRKFIQEEKKRYEFRFFSPRNILRATFFFIVKKN